MNTHTDLLNLLIKKYNLKSYLEIGVRTTEQNFNKIECYDKTGVDPNCTDHSIIRFTSDDFFKAHFSTSDYWLLPHDKKFDIIFIDGMHEAHQVKRDFENSLRCLNDNGFIVIHDTLPTKEETTCVPRGNATVWHGDVYKFAMLLREYSDINFVTVNFDCGCTIVWRKKCTGINIAIEPNWKTYLSNREILLKIIHPQELLQHLP